MRKRLLRRSANSFTLFRAISGLFVIAALEGQQEVLAWMILLIGGFSDFVDGLLARMAGGGSSWGARLDPLADKLLLIGPVIWLTTRSIIPLWAVWLLISRELVVSSWRAGKKEGGPASLGGKMKTILQFTSILMMLWPDIWGSYSLVLVIHKIGYILFWPSLMVAFISAIQYFICQLKSHQKKSQY